MSLIITKNVLARRTFLRGAGTMVALPLLDAMVAPLTALQKTAAKPVQRFGVVYSGNGADMSRWTPSTEGTGFEWTPSLKSLESLRDRVLVITGLDNRPALPQGDAGGEHSRAGVA